MLNVCLVCACVCLVCLVCLVRVTVEAFDDWKKREVWGEAGRAGIGASKALMLLKKISQSHVAT